MPIADELLDVLEAVAWRKSHYCVCPEEDWLFDSGHTLRCQRVQRVIEKAKRMCRHDGVLCTHKSDCAIHRAPALPVGPCTCSRGE